MEKRRGLLQRTAPLSRRQLLREVATASGAAALAGGVGWLAYHDQPVRQELQVIHTLKDFRVPPPPAGSVELAVIHGSDPAAMVRAAVERLGGMGRFVKPGERVLLKPNVGWDRQPEQAANTNPEVVAAVARLCREAGASQVLVSDVSLNDPYRCFSRSGIEAAAHAAGAVVKIPGQEDFLPTAMGGKLLATWPVCRWLHEVDRVINLPIVKHHSLSGCTLAMKNLYGMIGGRRNRLHQDIHTSIVDLAAAIRATLTIMDATRILKRNGPTGGNLDDVAAGDTIVAGTDPVAIDAYCLSFLELTPEQVPFLAMGEARGVGVVKWQGLRMSESGAG